MHHALEKGIGFLFQSQAPWGEFSSFASTDRRMKKDCVPDSAVFPSTCILYSLRFVDDPRARKMERKARQFLMDEMMPGAVWRYWTARGVGVVGPDLDDTCCASFLLRSHCPEIASGANMEVILGSRNQEGLFFTWIDKRCSLNDVDSAVNANVLLYLGERPETTAACDYLNRIVSSDDEASSYHYYLDDLALYYMMSRAYRNSVPRLVASRDQIVRKTLHRLTAGDGMEDGLLLAQGACTLMNFGCDHRIIPVDAVQRLVRIQEKDGGWPLAAFYAGPEPPAPNSVWFGSRELTTAFCLEALSRYSTAQDRVSRGSW